MYINRYIPFLILCCFLWSDNLWSQKEKKQYLSPKEKLNRAKMIQEKEPKAAIKLLEDIISEKRKGGTGLEADAYILLGDIYQQIDQKELALKRYQQADGFISKKQRALRSQNFYKLGKLYLDFNNEKQSKTYFDLCIKNNPKSEWGVRCREGLVDLEISQSNYDNSLQQIEVIQADYGTYLDSLDQSRLEAKKSKVYTQQNKLPEAEQAYNYSISNAPKSDKIAKKDIADIKEAEDLMVGNTTNTDDKIRVISTNLKQKLAQQLPAEIIIPDQLILADWHLANNEIPESERYIADAKQQLSRAKNAQLEAMVYKKSAKINNKKSAYKQAYEDLQNYVSAIEKKGASEQYKLDNSLEIVKRQGKLDILEKDIALEEKDQQLLHNQINTQKIAIGLLCLLLLAALVSFYFIMKNVQAKRRANQMLLLKSLRTQMNPHFIFNALNSVNSFIVKNDERAANKFLADFSKLMRMVLDYSQKDFITFEEEIELLELYLKLEHTRFRDKFEYSIEKNITPENLSPEIPPMLIQPFIENAVWHGLRYKETKGHLKITIRQEGNDIVVLIQDDGIGRSKSKTLKTSNQKKYKSTGIRNVDKRIQLINDLYTKNYAIEVSDLYPKKEDTGTLVQIKIPI